MQAQKSVGFQPLLLTRLVPGFAELGPSAALDVLLPVLGCAEERWFQTRDC